MLGGVLHLPTMSNVSAANTLNDKQLRLWGIPLSVLLLLLLQMPVYFPGRWDLLWKYIAISVPYTSLIWEVSRWLLIQVRHRYPAIEQTRKRVLGMFLSFFVVVCIGQALMIALVMALKLESPGWVSPLRTWLINTASSLFFIALIGGVYEAMYFFGQYKSVVQKAEHLKKQQVQQQLDALKSRVNPHFLFNSLTTLSALIGEDAPRAERFVDELSKVYRYLLRAGRQPRVTLGEELQFAESYVFLLKNRFEEGAFSLDVKSGAPLDFNQTLPALTLQNALDYLVRTQNLPLRIEVEMFDHHLQIGCDHRPKSISFDVPDNDWRHLESHGAMQRSHEGQKILEIPFSQNTATT